MLPGKFTTQSIAVSNYQKGTIFLNSLILYIKSTQRVYLLLKLKY